MRSITLPLVGPSILGAMVIAAAISFDEVLITNFTSGTHVTLPLFVLSRLHRTIDPSMNAVATILLVVPWLAVGRRPAVAQRRRSAAARGADAGRGARAGGMSGGATRHDGVGRIAGISKAYGDVTRCSPRPGDPRRLVLQPARARAGAGRRRCSRSWRGSRRPTPARSRPMATDITGRPPGAAAVQHGVPALRALPAHDGGGQRRLRADDRRVPERPSIAERRGASRRCSDWSGSSSLGPLPVRALRRAGAAGGGRARADQPPARPPARRAAVRAGPQRPLRAPRGAPSDPSGARHHVPVRHARPGRGAQHLPARGRDERGPARAGG